ncbi:MAG: hypothetical protein ACRDZ2_07480 [Ilumatobacteraceae bacterium]
MPAYRVRYEGPRELAIGIATALADAPGLDLTSSQPPQTIDAGVRLELVVEGGSDEVLDAVGTARSGLPEGARLQLDAAGR